MPCAAAARALRPQLPARAQPRRPAPPPRRAPRAQTLVDAPNAKKSDLRRARSGMLNLAPTSTGSATAIALIFPELKARRGRPWGGAGGGGGRPQHHPLHTLARAHARAAVRAARAPVPLAAAGPPDAPRRAPRPAAPRRAPPSPPPPPARPHAQGKLNGLAVRVPLTNASITDCVFEVKRPTTAEEVNTLLKARARARARRACSRLRRRPPRPQRPLAAPAPPPTAPPPSPPPPAQEASETYLAGILGFETRPLVSTDYINDARCAGGGGGGGAGLQWGAARPGAPPRLRGGARGARAHARASPRAPPPPPPPAPGRRSSIVDADCTQVIDGTMVKIYAWVRAPRGPQGGQLRGTHKTPPPPAPRPPPKPMIHPPPPRAAQYDNEVGYATRLADLAGLVVAKGL